MHLDNEPDADQIRLMIKTLATRPDAWLFICFWAWCIIRTGALYDHKMQTFQAGPVLGAILGNAVTVPKNATRDTLILFATAALQALVVAANHSVTSVNAKWKDEYDEVIVTWSWKFADAMMDERAKRKQPHPDEAL